MESSEPVESQPVETQPVKSSRVKMTDKQKADLKKHMDKAIKGGMSVSEAKSHRMKMMGRMRKGMSVKKAHADIMKS